MKKKKKKIWLRCFDEIVIVLQSETSLGRRPIRKSFETEKPLSDEKNPVKVERFWHRNAQLSHDGEPVSASQNVVLYRFTALFVCVSNSVAYVLRT